MFAKANKFALETVSGTNRTTILEIVMFVQRPYFGFHSFLIIRINEKIGPGNK